MYRAGPADQGINVGLSLNDIAKAYEKKIQGRLLRQKNVEVEGVQVVGFTGTRESDNNNIPKDDRIEGGDDIREVVMDWTSRSGGAPAADKQASCNSFVRNELIPGHERDDISSDNDEDPNGDTLDSIDVGKATQEEKEMDDMFKGSAYSSIEEVTQAREPEDGLHFRTRDDAFFFFCTFARKVGFSVKRSTTRRAGPEQEVEKQVFCCTK
ncbi:Protein FAR1-RELATED SEQUENCE 5 [Hordeum vulgare]|nr:Protein FAR1-RELATED SEQUENCE 5 [Hordeum vulgare]